MASAEETWVVIEGEPFLSRALAYREHKLAVAKEWWEFARKYGGNPPSSCSGISLYFNGTPPQGWTKQTSRGWSSPKKGTPAYDEAMKLPRLRSSWEIFGDDVISNLSYEGPDCSGGGGIGFFFFGVPIGWIGDTVVARIPHAARAAQEHLDDHPDHKITNGADTWQLPEGLREITEAQKDLMFAQARVDAEAAELSATA